MAGERKVQAAVSPRDPISAARRVAEVFVRWSRADHVRLHAGEMTAQEIRSVRAVLSAVRREVETAALDTLGIASRPIPPSVEAKCWAIAQEVIDRGDAADKAVLVGAMMEVVRFAGSGSISEPHRRSLDAWADAIAYAEDDAARKVARDRFRAALAQIGAETMEKVDAHT